MLLDLVEEVIPAADYLALVLVVDQVQLVALPGLSHLNKHIIISNPKFVSNGVPQGSTPVTL